MSLNKTIFMLALCLLAACGDINSDLNPSSQDQRSSVIPHSIGTQPGQNIAPFTATTSNNNLFYLTDYLAGGATSTDAIVMYFTMWCPVCMGHSDHLLFSVMPPFNHRGNIVYLLVDYVSGTVAATKASELANGYNGSPYIILADNQQRIFNRLHASMGSVIVIDNTGTIRMNEDYKTGNKLSTILNSILP